MSYFNTFIEKLENLISKLEVVLRQIFRRSRPVIYCVSGYFWETDLIIIVHLIDQPYRMSGYVKIVYITNRKNMYKKE